MPTRILVGADSLDRLPDEVSRIQRRCMLVTGRRALRLSGTLERVQDCLLEARIESVLFDQIEPNPTVATVMDGAEFARSKEAHWLLAVGGGSAIDAAKAIGLLATNPIDVRQFFAGQQPSRPPLPLVAVPTTSGTGSEVTPYSVVTDVAEGDKFGLNLPQLFPRLAILDPSLTLTMPDSVTVNTGLDALCHAIESMFSRQSSELSNLYARKALDRIVEHLPVVHAEADNLASRAAMQLAATYAGVAIANTTTLVPHAMGYPITVRYELPHGRVTALLLPAFLERLRDIEPDGVAFIGRVLGDENDAPEALRRFIESLGVAPRLGAYGVHEEDVELFSRQASGKKKQMENSPGEWLEESLREIYLRSL